MISQAFQILEECAKNQQCIYYQNLYEQIGLDRESPDDRNTGANLLAEINKISINKNKTMLSALVTLKVANKPADGFFEFAIELGKLGPDASEDENEKFWIGEVKKAFKTYNK